MMLNIWSGNASSLGSSGGNYDSTLNTIQYSIDFVALITHDGTENRIE